MSSSNIRVLVADDSPTARALIVSMLSASSGIEVIGEAKDGAEAVELTLRLHPDVVTMDIQMPNVDGFEATRRIMEQHPTPIVIVSALDTRSVEVSMEALKAGAVDIVPKPEGPSSPGHAQAARYLAATVRAMSDVKLVRRRPSPEFAPAVVIAAPDMAARTKIIAIAASTGGPAALHAVLSPLPVDFAVPIVVVQHMSEGFFDGFAKWLDGCVKVRVKLARRGEPLAPGTVYVAPEGQHLGVSARGTVILSDTAEIGGFRPAATYLFESVGKAYQDGAIGVILTGMGSDGLAGLRELKAAGGTVIAQDEATSDIFGMPGVVVKAGIANAVLPLGHIGPELMRLSAARRQV